MTPEEREIVRQTLTILDAIAIRVDKRIRDASQLKKGHHPIHRTIKNKLECARTLLQDIHHRKAALYKLLDLGAEQDKHDRDQKP